MTSSPFLTPLEARSPWSRRLPSPTLRTFPRFGFSLAVSGRTMPLLVLLSASTRLTRILSPSGRNLAIVYAPSKRVSVVRRQWPVVESTDPPVRSRLFSRPAARVVALEHPGQRVEQDVEVHRLCPDAEHVHCQAPAG